MLNWTGHALVDVGIAALCAIAHKQSPDELTLEDLDLAAEEMERFYFSGALTSYLTCVFMNSEYVQPGSGQKKDESRKRYANRILRAHRSPPDAEVAEKSCAFSGNKATHLIHRGQMPLLTGEGVLNFFPGAAGGLPIYGPYLTALQALPLGGRRSEGKLLVAHSDDPTLTLAFASRFVLDNKRLLALAMSGRLPTHEGPSEELARETASWDASKKRPKFPDAKVAFTLIASDLLDVIREQRQSGRPETPVSIQVYWLSSSGQGPSLELFSLPSNLIKFLREVSKAETNTTWQKLLNKGWGTEAEQSKARLKSRPAMQGPGKSRNPILNDLLAVYSSGFVDTRRARTFVRRHLLAVRKSAIQDPDDCNWGLTDLFLKDVLGMNSERIERIRAFADMVATYIAEKNDKKFFKALTFSERPWVLRNQLEKAQRREFVENNRLLFGFDDYVNVFEAEDDAGFADWSLVRDLICIRLVEQLYRAGWLTPDDLKSDAASEEESQAEEAKV